ncbi:MAG: hypothetical protein ACYC2I_03490 [Elusimicrobiales bacterium]
MWIKKRPGVYRTIKANVLLLRSEIMTNSKLMIVVVALMLATASAAKAGNEAFDFDGMGKSVTANCLEALKSKDGALAPLPQEPANPTDKVVITRKAYGEDGTQKIISVKYFIQPETTGKSPENTWVVGMDNKVYSISTARPLPDFAAPKSLAHSISLFERGAAGPERKPRCDSGCREVFGYVCISGKANRCSYTRCEECEPLTDENGQIECYCHPGTSSSWHNCVDTGNTCVN